MTSSKAHRLRRIFGADGKTLLVAMDHVSFMGPVPGLAEPVGTVEKVVRGGADAVMTTLGSARRIIGALDGRGLVLSVAIDATDPQGVVERAVALGVDSIKTLAFPGDEAGTVRSLGRYGILCDRWGIPFQAEVVPVSFAATEKHTPEAIATAARIGAESGADYVKTLYTGDPESFRRVVEGAGVPVIVLGGPRQDIGDALLRMVADTLRAGGAGIAFGRSIWSDPDPERMTRDLAGVVHGA